MKQLSSHLKNSLMAVLLSMGASSLANAATQDGDMCGTSNFTTDTKFKCSNLFQGQRLTVAEIYQQGYRVVSTVSIRPSPIEQASKHEVANHQ